MPRAPGGPGAQDVVQRRDGLARLRRAGRDPCQLAGRRMGRARIRVVHEGRYLDDLHVGVDRLPQHRDQRRDRRAGIGLEPAQQRHEVLPGDAVGGLQGRDHGGRDGRGHRRRLDLPQGPGTGIADRESGVFQVTQQGRDRRIEPSPVAGQGVRRRSPIGGGLVVQGLEQRRRWVAVGLRSHRRQARDRRQAQPASASSRATTRAATTASISTTEASAFRAGAEPRPDGGSRPGGSCPARSRPPPAPGLPGPSSARAGSPSWRGRRPRRSPMRPHSRRARPAIRPSPRGRGDLDPSATGINSRTVRRPGRSPVRRPRGPPPPAAWRPRNRAPGPPPGADVPGPTRRARPRRSRHSRRPARSSPAHPPAAGPQHHRPSMSRAPRDHRRDLSTHAHLAPTDQGIAAEERHDRQTSRVVRDPRGGQHPPGKMVGPREAGALQAAEFRRPRPARIGTAV